ncbi:MAG: phosphoadenylyl-sulfate reductase [Salinibacter sp.]
MSTTSWTEDDIAALNEDFEEKSPSALLDRIYDAFADEEIAMGTGFGASGVVLMDLIARRHPGATVFYLDTDLLFPETYELRDRLRARFDLNIVRVHSGPSLDEQAEEHGEKLWNDDPDQCCFLRKVKPLREYLSDKTVWLTAIRRDQSPTRANTQHVEWNPANEVVKVNPLAYWTEDDVWAHIDRHDLPYNPLHDEGYPSIGCMPCTERVGTDADDPRAGRWSDSSKTECGLHRELQTVETS